MQHTIHHMQHTIYHMQHTTYHIQHTMLTAQSGPSGAIEHHFSEHSCAAPVHGGTAGRRGPDIDSDIDSLNIVSGGSEKPYGTCPSGPAPETSPCLGPSRSSVRSRPCCYEPSSSAATVFDSINKLNSLIHISQVTGPSGSAATCLRQRVARAVLCVLQSPGTRRGAPSESARGHTHTCAARMLARGALTEITAV